MPRRSVLTLRGAALLAVLAIQALLEAPGLAAPQPVVPVLEPEPSAPAHGARAHASGSPRHPSGISGRHAAAHPVARQAAVRPAARHPLARQAAAHPMARQAAAHPLARQAAARPMARQAAVHPVARQAALRPATRHPVATTEARHLGATPQSHPMAAAPQGHRLATSPNHHILAARPGLRPVAATRAAALASGLASRHPASGTPAHAIRPVAALTRPGLTAGNAGDEPSPVAEPVVAGVSAASAAAPLSEAPPANALADLSWEADRLVLRFTREVPAFRHFRLLAPRRLVVDLAATQPPAASDFVIGGPLLTRVRSAHLAGAERLVLELPVRVDESFEARLETRQLIVRLTPVAAEAGTGQVAAEPRPTPHADALAQRNVELRNVAVARRNVAVAKQNVAVARQEVVVAQREAAAAQQDVAAAQREVAASPGAEPRMVRFDPRERALVLPGTGSMLAQELGPEGLRFDVSGVNLGVERQTILPLDDAIERITVYTVRPGTLRFYVKTRSASALSVKSSQRDGSTWLMLAHATPSPS